ncbi:hypothetical protein BVY03_04290, partial [bacterium K02(2017)]
LNDSLIPKKEITNSGPPRDGIPVLSNPVFINSNQAKYLSDGDEILGISLNGIAKAYPVGILNLHEIVNDVIDKKPIMITFCPLCGTGSVFESKIKTLVYEYKVSGLMHNSDSLLYDKQTKSLWSQHKMNAVAGKMKNTTLKPIKSIHTTWGQWKVKHPQTRVLAKASKVLFDKDKNSYALQGQEKLSLKPYYLLDDSYPLKEWTIGLKVGDKIKLYPYSKLAKDKKKSSTLITDKIKNKIFSLHVNLDSRRIKILDSHGKHVSAFAGYWFAVRKIYPDADIY